MSNEGKLCRCGGNYMSPQNLTFAIEIHPNFQCTCLPCSPATQLQTSDVVSGLLRYNSNLTKYLSAYQHHPTSKEVTLPHPEPVKNPQQSIVELYNLKFLSPYDHPLQETNPQKLEVRAQPISSETQTSPRNVIGQPGSGSAQKKGKIAKSDENAEKLQKHLKQMAVSSRYLSNTGFKKYFGRECFQNYGRQNTTGVADGIIYNNYLKTFNISPHCGGNMPLTQEVYSHSLVAGDCKNYDNTKIPPTHYGTQADRVKAAGPLQKPISMMEQVVEQSQKYQQRKEKYTCPPQLNIISHCPDILKSKRKKDGIVHSEGRTKYYSELESNQTLKKQAGHYDKPTVPEETGSLGRKDQSVSHLLTIKANGLDQVSAIRHDEGRSIGVGDRQGKKNQIIDACYKNSNLAHAIRGKNGVQCPVCRTRMESKCCS